MATKAEKQAPNAPARELRRVVKGVVTSDKMQKTITVEVDRFVRHPKFGKFIRKSSTCKAHDEKGEAKAGDLVEIMETRPLSATKRWRLLRVLRRSGASVAAGEPAS